MYPRGRHDGGRIVSLNMHGMSGIAAVLLVPLVQGQTSAPPTPDRCPVVVEINAHNRMFENRFHGRYRVSMNRLLSDVQGCCKEAGPVSSVTIRADKAVPYGTVHALIERIQQVLPASTPLVIKSP